MTADSKLSLQYYGVTVIKNVLVFFHGCRSSVVEPTLPSAASQVDSIPLDQDMILPHCDPIPAEHVEYSKPWTEVSLSLMVTYIDGIAVAYNIIICT